ncbi:bifunctional adenosylcobinamide kinase/adenosylcobinamide-phosphate guanylyltransferase [Telmatospirillum siberiense]|uniref:Bifunctional adenosylcobalamin biosynthesis protein n=2 Tax=Telmatospirillum siberiense TaxID=382514 RepID=A0A2N3PMX3_9PROT|nr:bifunctional adenosylcobinamide kinase/adenosylcobinamide-phosphate guanylyltransferase [Telmatospirillum siberiense]PKU21748.1 bifunctional adenosylcobinamide kinase/adenosylcobinamide-phosphate guanylyltransferase [Telmatospirillum siberiense]
MADHHHPLPPLTLVLGGARSGKSTYAESLLTDVAQPVYLATARAGDGEMVDRIRLHRERRGAAWTTIEEPLDLVGTLSRHAHPDKAILVDCLTLWLSNLMLENADIGQEIDRLAQALPGLKGPVLFVANEVGLGIVPDNAMARAFRDHAGRLNQSLAARCQRVVFVAAGLPLLLKDSR